MELRKLKNYLAGKDAFSDFEQEQHEKVTESGQSHAVHFIIGILELPRIEIRDGVQGNTDSIRDLEATATEIWLTSDENLVFMHVVGEGKSEIVTLKKGAKFQADIRRHDFNTKFRLDQAIEA